MSVKQNHYIRQSLKTAMDKGAMAQTLINQMPTQYDMIVDTYILQSERAQGNYTAANGNRKTQYEIAQKLYHNR